MAANEREDLRIAGYLLVPCEAVKALPRAKRKDSRTYLALTMIQAIYREEKQLKELSTQERQNRRQLSVRPLVEAYFTWVRENLPKVPQKSKTWEAFNLQIINPTIQLPNIDIIISKTKTGSPQA